MPLARTQTESTAASGDTFVYVGTYTPNGGGIHLFKMDANNGALSLVMAFLHRS